LHVRDSPLDRGGLYNDGLLAPGIGDIDRAKFIGGPMAWNRTKETLFSHGDMESQRKI
jgi:hypothetical protein